MQEIVNIVKCIGVQVCGLILLLNKIEKFIVLCGLYIDKKLCDQWEICMYKCLFDIVDLIFQIVDVLMKFDFVVGVDVEIKV